MNPLQPTTTEQSLTIRGCQLTPKGAIFDENLPFEQWQSIGATLRYLEKSILFWVGDWINYGEKNFGEKYSQAIESTGYDVQTLKNAAWVASKVEKSRRRDNLSFSHHAEVASLPPKEQEEMLDQVQEHGMTRQELRRAIQKSKMTKKLMIPSKRYRVLYADPPWPDRSFGLDDLGQAKYDYAPMSIEELCALGVSGIAEDEAVLFLWVPSPTLADCWEVITAWGFKYQNSMVWHKDTESNGQFLSVRHELLLICTRGNYLPEIDQLYPSVIMEKRSEKRYEKPDVFRKMIDTLYPSGRRIDLFPRSKTRGWEAYWSES